MKHRRKENFTEYKKHLKKPVDKETKPPSKESSQPIVNFV